MMDARREEETGAGEAGWGGRCPGSSTASVVPLFPQQNNPCACACVWLVVVVVVMEVSRCVSNAPLCLS